MGRRAEGTAEWRGGQWCARITMPDGTRPWIPMPGIPQHDDARAKQVAAAMAQRAKARGVVPSVRDETVDEYMDRWVKWRTAKGMTSAHIDRKMIVHHFSERHGLMPMGAITKAVLEDFVTALDAKVRAHDLSWKYATNIWGSLSAMFRDASSAKDRVYRILEANPALGVAAPDKGIRRAKTYIYPDEFLALVDCATIPVVRRALYAWTVYVKLRSAEVEALEWSDVDELHGSMLIHLAVDRSPGADATKSVKSGHARRVTIEPELLPLVKAMRERATTARVFPVVPDPSGRNGYAAVLRADLKLAGCKRAELHATTLTRKAMTFHDLRATGITWGAVRGDNPHVLQMAAGHESFTTTQEYIREAEIHRAGFGQVFPPLPDSFLRDLCVVQITPNIVPLSQKPPVLPGEYAPTVGLEPIGHGPGSLGKDAVSSISDPSNRPRLLSAWDEIFECLDPDGVWQDRVDISVAREGGSFVALVEIDGRLVSAGAKSVAEAISCLAAALRLRR